MSRTTVSLSSVLLLSGLALAAGGCEPVDEQDAPPELPLSEEEPAPATEVGPSSDLLDLQERAAAADAVLTGTVEELRYGWSDSAHPVPVTHVRYRTDDGGTTTLTVAGGPLPDGSVAQLVGVPVFEPGDRDILFVAGNGETGCPLVDCAAGRLRVIEDRVFTNDGRALVHDDRGRLVLGTPRDLAAVRTDAVAGHAFERVTDRELDPSLDDAARFSAVMAALGPFDR